MALAVLVVANDFTALSIALSAMEQDFGADVTTVQWVNNGYALVFGVLSLRAVASRTCSAGGGSSSSVLASLRFSQ